MLARGTGFQGNMRARLNDGTTLYCAKGSIWLNVQRKLIGKIGGIAGTGQRAREWIAGPNLKRVHPSWKRRVKAGRMVPGLSRHNGGCAPRYQYPYKHSPFNGNSFTKPIVQWFYSWQVDGTTIPEAFGYRGNRNVHWFNKADRVAPPKG